MANLLDTIFLQPLLQIYAGLFALVPAELSAGERLILFSIFVNLLLLPIYLQMEKSSKALRKLRECMGRDVARMRRHFQGRERYFYVRAVHRQYGYSPIATLAGSADLFVQILVFATVYRYLSNLAVLRGASFGPISDLARPDGLLAGLNLLPIVMTVINGASVFAYVEDRSSRLKALALAALFLLLLYRSPAGLVLYWTTNNLFSLLRNLVDRRLIPRIAPRYTRPVAALLRQR
jgi:membrane protein insertase Oxa1/YidC/SpoIIIJ